jgi:hypothetical protein
MTNSASLVGSRETVTVHSTSGCTNGNATSWWRPFWGNRELGGVTLIMRF